jgi:hypothetical protein
VRVFSHGIAYDLPGVLPQVGRYLADGLKLGYQVVYLKPRSASPKRVLAELSLPSELHRNPALKFVDEEKVYFERRRFNVAQLIWEGRRLVRQAQGEGYRRVRIIADLRPVLAREVPACKLVAMEYLVDEGFHAQKRAHGIGIFPATIPDPGLASCILCRHPWIIGPAGPIRNPYYNDPVLCQARRYLGGEVHGGIGSH